MVNTTLLRKHSITITGDIATELQVDAKKWNTEALKRWITNAGGSLTASVTSDTTHLVSSKKHWQAQSSAVKAALERGRIKIVTAEWLHKTLSQSKKVGVTPYMWEKLDKSAISAAARAEKERLRAEKGAHERVKLPGGAMTQALQEHTDEYLGAKERAKMEKQTLASKAREREEKGEERKRKRAAAGRDGQATVFRRGAKRARNEIFSDNHHVYMDETGFKHDVVVTKVNAAVNRNERCTITIYESNSAPHTYATNVQTAATGSAPQNDIIAAIGTNYPTAFRSFKKTFAAKTGVQWDARIDHAVARAKEAQRRRAGGGSEGSSAGAGHGGTGVITEEDFRRMPFQYQPPAYGPRGKLPVGCEDKGAEIGALGRGGVAEPGSVEFWMSGAGEAGLEEGVADVPATAPQSRVQSRAASEAPTALEDASFDRDEAEGIEQVGLQEQGYAGEAIEQTGRGTELDRGFDTGAGFEQTGGVSKLEPTPDFGAGFGGLAEEMMPWDEPLQYDFGGEVAYQFSQQSDDIFGSLPSGNAFEQTPGDGRTGNSQAEADVYAGSDAANTAFDTTFATATETQDATQRAEDVQQELLAFMQDNDRPAEPCSGGLKLGSSLFSTAETSFETTTTGATEADEQPREKFEDAPGQAQVAGDGAVGDSERSIYENATLPFNELVGRVVAPREEQIAVQGKIDEVYDDEE